MCNPNCWTSSLYLFGSPFHPARFCNSSKYCFFTTIPALGFFFLSFCFVEGLSLFLSRAIFPLGISLHGGIHGGGRTQWRVSKNRATRKQKHFFSWIFSSFIFYSYFLCSWRIPPSFSHTLSLSLSLLRASMTVGATAAAGFSHLLLICLVC